MTATNTVATNSTNLSNLGATSLDGLLKDVYLPGLTDTVFNDASFTALIEQSASQIDFEGQRVKKGFKTQRGGGVGAFAEGGDFVDSVSPAGKQGSETLKYLNVYFSITGPAIEAAKQAGAGSFVNVTADSFEDVMKNAKNDTERMIMGAQDGLLAQINGGTINSGSTLTVEGPAFFDTQFATVGSPIEFRDNTYNAATLRTDYTSGTIRSSTITGATPGNKKAGTRGTIVIGDTLADTIADKDWICRKGSYATDAGVKNCLEPNGLFNLISDGATDTGTVHGAESQDNCKLIWGLDRTAAANSYLKSYVKNFAAELDEQNLTDAMMELRYTYQADPNLLVVSPRAMQKYFLNVKEDRRFNTMQAFEWIGGYKGLGIQLGDKQLMLTSVGSCPTGVIYMINTKDFAFASMTKGYKWLTKGGQILTQKEGSDSQFATAVNYMNFVCNDPGRQLKGYGVTE